MSSRLSVVLRRNHFRDHNGSAYRKSIQIFSEVNMSAKDKVALIFLLPYVLGHNADILPQDMREPFLTALAYAQLMIIATSGHRSYTKNEFQTIFDRGYVLLFGALQRIHHLDFNGRVRLHRENPGSQPPKPFQRRNRYHSLCL